MAEREDRAGGSLAGASGRPSQASSGSPTRGFLFADLRGYTAYVEAHGAADAADLLLRYRALVRQAVAAHDGAEIKTEGDSFYVVFPAVSSAVLCGLAIVAAARSEPAGGADRRIHVGIGVHAGETVETPDGYVGSPVNIAARICAIAGPGEVLVSDTVRALTQTVLPVSFVSRGRRALKGVSEPVGLFAVADGVGTWAQPAKRWFRRRRSLAVGALVMSGILVAGLLAWTQLRRPSGLPPGPWKIGVTLPLTTDPVGVPLRDAVQLAIDDVNANGGIGGVKLTLDIRDDQTLDQTAGTAKAFAADPWTLAMIGPYYSTQANFQVPVTNAAGLLQCSGSSTDPGLTKPRHGALDLRNAHPDRINYVRTVPDDDISAMALASFILRDLKVTKTLVVDYEDFALTHWFADAFEAVGGDVIQLALNPGASPESVLGPLSDPADAPGAVVFGGFADTAVPLRKAMAAGGFARIPLLSWDSIRDGSGAAAGSYIELAGPDAVGTYMTHPTIAPPKAAFVEKFRAAYNTLPGDYAAATYACTEIILEAVRAVAATGPSAGEVREAVRAYAVDAAHQYETVIGPLGFDKNGDSTRQFADIYRVDPSAAGGNGDWVLVKQQDYGPAP